MRQRVLNAEPPQRRTWRREAGNWPVCQTVKSQTRYNRGMTPTSRPARARIASGTPIHYVAFNLLAGAEYLCIPSVVRELGLEKTVRGVASPSQRPAFEFRSARGGPNDPGTWHYPEDCA